MSFIKRTAFLSSIVHIVSREKELWWLDCLRFEIPFYITWEIHLWLVLQRLHELWLLNSLVRPQMHFLYTFLGFHIDCYIWETWYDGNNAFGIRRIFDRKFIRFTWKTSLNLRLLDFDLIIVWLDFTASDGRLLLNFLNRWERGLRGRCKRVRGNHLVLFDHFQSSSVFSWA